ncbi:MAG: biotin/lipoate A/B protein ligase family protein [Pseudothermotoga sp.]
MEVKVLRTWNFPGKLNMALDFVLSQFCKEPVLRFYTWARPTLSVGKHQRHVNLNTQFMKEKMIGCVVRPTGGRAVLHWDELTYSVVMPIDDPHAKEGVLKTYLVISECIKNALCHFGYNVQIQPTKRSTSNTAACFDAPSSYEITINGKKVVGSAQMRNERAVLQHGSIVLKEHVEEYAKCLNLEVEDLRERMAGLFEFHQISVEALAERLQEEFVKVFGEAEPLLVDEILVKAAIEREDDFLCRVN